MTQNPYVNINSENSSGIIPEILENLVSSCCKTCKAHGESFVDYQTSSDTTGKRMDEKSLQMSISHSSDVTFPIYGYMDQDTYKAEYGFAPIVESPGVTFIVNFSDDNEKSSLVLDALFKCWPLFAFLLILIWLSGIIIWFLVSQFLGFRKRLVLFFRILSRLRHFMRALFLNGARKKLLSFPRIPFGLSLYIVNLTMLLQSSVCYDNCFNIILT